MLIHITESLDSFVLAYYAVNEKLRKPFMPIEEIVYKPVYALMEMQMITETTATLFVAFQLSFLFSLGLNFIKDPQMRKWYSTLTGLMLGFYYHGVSYLFVIFHLSCVYPFMKYLPREKTMLPVLFLAGLGTAIRCFFNFYEGNLDG